MHLSHILNCPRSRLKLELGALSKKVLLVICTKGDETSYFNLTIRKSRPDFTITISAPIQIENYLPADINFGVSDQRNHRLYQKQLGKGIRDLIVCLNVQQELYLSLSLANFKQADKPPILRFENDVSFFLFSLPFSSSSSSYLIHLSLPRKELFLLLIPVKENLK